jgi:hypothetical protein
VKKFSALHAIAINQFERLESGGDLDHHDAVDAVIVAKTLMDWVSKNVDKALREDIAEKLSVALGIGEA